LRKEGTGFYSLLPNYFLWLQQYLILPMEKYIWFTTKVMKI
jgi:hypothetical protein